MCGFASIIQWSKCVFLFKEILICYLICYYSKDSALKLTQICHKRIASPKFTRFTFGKFQSAHRGRHGNSPKVTSFLNHNSLSLVTGRNKEPTIVRCASQTNDNNQWMAIGFLYKIYCETPVRHRAHQFAPIVRTLRPWSIVAGAHTTAITCMWKLNWYCMPTDVGAISRQIRIGCHSHKCMHLLACNCLKLLHCWWIPIGCC